jgi:hypothetical protein
LLNEPQRGEPRARAVTKTKEEGKGREPRLPAWAERGKEEKEMKTHNCNSMLRAVLCLAVCMLGLSLSASADDHKGKIITFDAPGAGTEAGQGTFAQYINDPGLIAGYFVDSSGLSHGFLWYPNGKFTSFDAPHATGGTLGVIPNNAGEIAGIYFDSVGMHGFVRSPHGSFKEFDFPNSPEGTFTQAMNSAGTVTGPGWDANGLSHGFIRHPDGHFTEFDPPGLGTECSGVFNFSCGTWPLSINSKGSITGDYNDPNGASHGFVRAADGTITEFEPMDAALGDAQGGAGYWINNAGEIVGAYLDSNWVWHGFLRDPDGHITEFSVPGAGTGYRQGSFSWAMNQANVVTGYWLDTNNANHGFVRTPDGRITKFDAPGAGTGAGQGTTPENINDAGWISGLYVDNNNVTHGFVRIPDPRK